MTFSKKQTTIGITVLVLVIGSGIWFLLHGNSASSTYRTAGIVRDNLLVSISATGTLQPEEVIDVGAQVAGQIIAFGKDAAQRTIDYGSAVEEGTVLARIDDAIYSADLAQAEAQLQSAQAAKQRAEEDLKQLQAKLQQAERDWVRAQKIGPSEALAQAAYDGYLSAYETASANVGVGKAAIQQAQAGVSQASAALRKAQRNLSLCTIKSPVKGVIIDRRVNIGQTVVASLNAPSLFLIAKDLKQMQVWVAVNEADISKIHRGQPVTFTVDAFPGETFKGQVGKVRLNASMTQNVVIYTVEILTDNSSGKLLPYLTANVRFELSRREKVLLAPSAALRWKPSSEQIAPRWREKSAERSEENGSEGRRPAGAEKGPPAESGRGRLWVAEGKFVRPLVVRSGDGDGTLTEVAGEGVIEGLEVVIGLHQQNNARGDTSNPFAPSFPRGGGRPR